jgi:hypothetical protein
MRWATVLLTLLALAPPASATKRSPYLETSLPPHIASSELRALRHQVRDMVQRGQRPVVVFDLDETIVISRPGQPNGIYWDPNLRRIPGAKQYIKDLLEDGATIVYLTGRKESMREATIAELRRLDIPMGEDIPLVMNKTMERGYFFKMRYGPRLHEHGTPVAFFENEKDVSRMFRRFFPRARVFRLNTRARYPDIGKDEDPKIHVIDHFHPDARNGIRAKVRFGMGQRGPRQSVLSKGRAGR